MHLVDQDVVFMYTLIDFKIVLSIAWPKYGSLY